MAIGHLDGFGKSYFDSKACTDSYVALDADTSCKAFLLRNLTGKDILIRVGAAGDAITIKDGIESPLLKGDPSGYQIKNNTDAGSVTVELVIFSEY